MRGTDKLLLLSAKDLELIPERDSRSNTPRSSFKMYRQVSPQPLVHGSPEMKQLQRDHYYIEKLKHQRQKMETLTKQFQKKERLIEQQNQKIDRLEQHIACLPKPEDLEKKQREVQQCRELYADLQKEMEKQRKELLEAAKKISDRQQAVVTGNEQQKGYMETIQLLKSRLEKQQYKLTATTAQHDAEIESIRQKWGPFKQELEELRKRSYQLAEGRKAAEVEQHKLQNQVKQLRRLLEEEKSKGLSIKQQLESATKRYSESRKNDEHKYSELVEVLRTELERTELRLENLEKEIKEVRSADHQKSRRISQLTMTIRQQIGLINELEAVAKQFEHQQRKSELTMQKYRNIERTYEQTIRQLRAELEHSKQPTEASTRNSELQQMRAQLSRVRNSQIDKMDRLFNEFRLHNSF